VKVVFFVAVFVCEVEMSEKLSHIGFMKMMEMGGTEYARSEAWDIARAAGVISTLAEMAISEVHEPDDMQSLANIMRSLMEFINGEIQEMVKAAKEGKDSEEKKASAEVKSKDESKEVEEGLNYSYVKSLGIQPPDYPDFLAVKFVAKNEIKGYSHLWGNPDKADLEVEYFTKDTNFWDDVLGKNPRPLTWDHAQDESFKGSPVIGQIVDFGDDEIGRWYLGKLERSHQYNKAIAELIKQGKLGTSSDSAPQYVERVKTGKAVWLKTWPFFAGALTDVPCEPRMIGSLEFLKSLGINLPENPPSDDWQIDAMVLDYFKTKYKV
jgi:hypothetical protein